MNNNIHLCKAKRIDNGELAEGYYFKIWDDHYILWGTTNDHPNKIKVDPNTICRSTGEEKDNRLVYSGDKFIKEYINPLTGKEVKEVYVVDWWDGMGMWKLRAFEGERFSMPLYSILENPYFRYIENIHDKECEEE